MIDARLNGGGPIYRFLAAATEVWTTAGRPMPIGRVSSTAEDLQHDARRVDASAGCEFLDDYFELRDSLDKQIVTLGPD